MSITSQKVAVIIITWNSAAEIEDCLQSVIKENPAEIIIVDNDSKDETLTIVHRSAPQSTIIELKQNKGFSVGCNIGINASKSPYILLLNSDAILNHGYLDLLVKELEGNLKAASAMGKLFYKQNNQTYIDSAGILLRYNAMSPLDRGYKELDIGQYDKAEEIFGPSAAAAIYRRKALLSLSNEIFDEDLFAYYEDVDLAWRLRCNGWIHLYIPQATAEHARRGPENKPKEIAAQAYVNRILVWLKNDTVSHLCIFGPIFLTRELLRLLRLFIKRPKLVPLVLSGLRKIPIMIKKRKNC